MIVDIGEFFGISNDNIFIGFEFLEFLFLVMIYELR